MTYRIMLLVELTKLSDMSDNFVVIITYQNITALWIDKKVTIIKILVTIPPVMKSPKALHHIKSSIDKSGNA